MLFSKDTEKINVGLFMVYLVMVPGADIILWSIFEVLIIVDVGWVECCAIRGELVLHRIEYSDVVVDERAPCILVGCGMRYNE